MRAPLVLISVRVKLSNIPGSFSSASARRSLRRDAGGPAERHGDRRLAGDARVEFVRLHDHLFHAELGELLLHGWIPPPSHRLFFNATNDVARRLLRHHHPPPQTPI